MLPLQQGNISANKLQRKKRKKGKGVVRKFVKDIFLVNDYNAEKGKEGSK